MTAPLASPRFEPQRAQWAEEFRAGRQEARLLQCTLWGPKWMRHQFDRSGKTFFGSDAKNNTIHADQLTRNIMLLGSALQARPGNELLRDLPLERDAVGTLSGHGFHPLKAQLTLSNH